MKKKKACKGNGGLCVLKAYRKVNGLTFHQWRINGKRVTYGKYMKERMTCIYHEPYVQRYATFTKSGSIVEVEIFYKEK